MEEDIALRSLVRMRESKRAAPFAPGPRDTANSDATLKLTVGTYLIIIIILPVPLFML